MMLMMMMIVIIMIIIIMIIIIMIIIKNFNSIPRSGCSVLHGVNPNIPETRKYWVDVQQGVVSSHGEKDPL